VSVISQMLAINYDLPGVAEILIHRVGRTDEPVNLVLARLSS